MQTKINSFFKPQNPSSNNQFNSQQLFHLQNSVAHDAQRSSDTEEEKIACGNGMESTSEISESATGHFSRTSVTSKILKNKRSYAQLHLDLGQSDFLLHSCSTCGFKYACGDEADEKLHKEVHNEYTKGILFKGWEKERVISISSTKEDRVILVLDGDPPAHKKRVEKVLQMMEVELGSSSGSLIHKLCKVYLYVSQRRIVGCLVAEPISEAYRVLRKSEASRSLDNAAIAKKSRLQSSVLQFGSISLRREAKEKSSPQVKMEALTEDFMGAIILEREAVPASCGIRAIWVAPAIRRKHIATRLLATARKSFIEGIELDKSQLAFSDPTWSGRALASRYFGSSFLVYRTHI
ncbi:hypothetical protein M9H77_34368 [Catharanthus roseus]|uniref:Uncharacterized protein n=1 Tax=Catharanthus roseus TaxID=4058 RepID=A0ACB9ZL86_CATRO|nr:hypothetical protein M9H77_34368 [Catharanthus roseus]